MKKKLVKIFSYLGAISGVGLLSAVTLTSCTTTTGPKKEINKSELRTINSILSNCLNGETPSITALNSTNNITNIKQKICKDLKISDPNNIKKVQFISDGSDKYLYNAVVEFDNDAISIDVDKDRYFTIVQNVKDNAVTLTTKEPIRFVDESQTKGIFINTNQLHNTIQNYISNYNFLVDLNTNSQDLVKELNVSDAFEFNGGKVDDVVFEKCKEDNTKINANVVFSKEVEKLEGDKFEYSQPSKKSIVNTKTNCFNMDEGFNFTEKLLSNLQKDITNYLTTKNSIDDLNGEALSMLKEAISKTTSINQSHITSLVFANVGTDLDDIKLSITFDKKIRITDSSGQIQTTFNDFNIVNNNELVVNKLHYNAEINIVDPNGLYTAINNYVNQYHFLNDLAKNKQQLLNTIVSGNHLYIKTNGGSLDDIRFTSTTQNSVKVSLVFSKQTSIENDTAQKFTGENNGLVYNTTTPITFVQGVEIGGLDNAQKSLQTYVDKYHQLTDLNKETNINALKTTLTENITVTKGLEKPTITNVVFEQGTSTGFVNATITFNNFVQPLDATTGFVISGKTIKLSNLTYIDGIKVNNAQGLFEALQSYVNQYSFISGINKNITNLVNQLNNNTTLFNFNGGSITSINFTKGTSPNTNKLNATITFSKQTFVVGANNLFASNENNTTLTTSTMLDFNEGLVIANTTSIVEPITTFLNGKHTISEMINNVENLKTTLNSTLNNSVNAINFVPNGDNKVNVTIEFNKVISVTANDGKLVISKQSLSKNDFAYDEAIEITNAQALYNLFVSFFSTVTIPSLFNNSQFRDALLNIINDGAYGTINLHGGKATSLVYSYDNTESTVNFKLGFNKYTIINDDNNLFMTPENAEEHYVFSLTNSLAYKADVAFTNGDLTSIYNEIVKYVSDKYTINDLNDEANIRTLKENIEALETSTPLTNTIQSIVFTNANSSNKGANVDIEFNTNVHFAPGTNPNTTSSYFNVGTTSLTNKEPFEQYIGYVNISNFVDTNKMSKAVSDKFKLENFPTVQTLATAIEQYLPNKNNIQDFINKNPTVFTTSLSSISNAKVIAKTVTNGEPEDLLTFSILFDNYQYAIFDVLVVPTIMTIDNNSWKGLNSSSNITNLDLRHYNFTSIDNADAINPTKGVIGNNSVTTIYLPDSVTNIGVSAFLNCATIRNINSSQGDNKLPPYVRNICRKAFSGCTNLSTLQYPTGCEVATDAFNGNTTHQTYTPQTTPAANRSINREE